MLHEFPPVDEANEDGLLAVGGDLSIERLLSAYRKGIFPWYNRRPILWWFMNPRFVLFPEKIKISKSLNREMQRHGFQFTINTAFRRVMTECKLITRKGNPGTWIQQEMIDAYTHLQESGYAQSAELWDKEELIGGLYGVRMGKIFFGESMFSKKSNASKIAFVKMVDQLKKEGVVMIDCQTYSKHLENFGAEMIDGKLFSRILDENLNFKETK
jgi:leucyl/phenylalanyl-tRNA---protein transferase